jgi:putative glutamine amidotransferase
MQTSQKSLSNSKPVILITTSNVTDLKLADIVGDTDIAYADKATAQAIIKAGGIPLYLPTFQTPRLSDLEVYIELADGLVLPGADRHVSPALYGGVIGTDDVMVDSQRDEIDIHLAHLAHSRKMPLMGICKGMQIMNVALGGTLYQSVSADGRTSVSHSIPRKRTQITHEATLAEGSFLKELFKSSKIGLNGGHQQAVHKVSSDVQASAVADDGIVEAYEGKNYPFLLGIQFHAELMRSSKPHRAIFAHFIEASKTYKEHKTGEEL